MDSFEAGRRWLSPRQANRGASLNLVSRAATSDKLAYQESPVYLSLSDIVLLDHAAAAFLPYLTT